jgi:hypothetical protein
LISICTAADAQPVADRIQTLLDRNRQAIVKVIVRGVTPDGADKTNEGSGFFIYSADGFSYIVTAAHVLGSNATNADNPHWKVEPGGVLRRTIEILSLDDHNNLVRRSENADRMPIQLAPELDLALLMIPRDGYKTLAVAGKLAERTTTYDLLLMGFKAGSTRLSIPTPTGLANLRRRLNIRL